MEVKSFLGRSFFNELENAIGQYILYRDILVEKQLDFELYLAVSQGTYKSSFQRKLTQMTIRRNQVNLLIFSPEQEVIERWIS